MSNTLLLTDALGCLLMLPDGPLTVTRSHAPGDLFPKGETTVQYTAVDPSGNNRTCDIHIVIKGVLSSNSGQDLAFF